MNVSDIHTTNWQMSLAKPDTIVEGREDIEQCIDVILKTRKGEDPLRPHFGCGIFDYIDRPVNTSIPSMKKEILDAIARYEPRVQIVSLVATQMGDSRILFNIGYKTPEGNLEAFDFALTGATTGGTAAPLALSATYEDGAFRYHIALILDGTPAVPDPPSSGFASITDMMTWLNNFWGIYGTWFWLFGQKKVMLYVPASVAQSGSLTITSDTNVLAATFPDLDINEFFGVVFKDPDGNRIQPYDDTSNNTRGSVLAYVQSNYSQYGTWSVDGDKLVLNGSVPLDGFTLEIDVVAGTAAFSEDFNLGFEA